MKVLIADDNALIREVLRQALAPLDWELEVLSDGEEVLEFVSGVHTPLVALIDSDLPGVSGIDLARRFAGRHPEESVGLLLVSTKCDPRHIEEGFMSGAMDFVVLPADPSVIRARAASVGRTLSKICGPAPSVLKLSDDAFLPSAANVRASSSTLVGKLLKIAALNKASDLIMEAVVGMGFPKANRIPEFKFQQSEPSFASWCCLVAPSCGIWVDVMVETDRSVAMNLFERLTGVPADSAKDATDTLGEIANLVQGGLKAALQAEGFDTITPVVPKQVPAANLKKLNDHTVDRVRSVLDVGGGAVFSVSLFVFERSIVRKTVESLRQRDVTIEALPSPNGADLKILNRGVMLDDRWIANLRNRFLGDSRRIAVNVVEPAGLMNLFSGL